MRKIKGSIESWTHPSHRITHDFENEYAIQTAKWIISIVQVFY